MKSRGFTLVELLTVIFILSLLASIVIVSASSARVKSRDNRRKIDIDTVAQSLELYYAQHKTYPCNACTGFNSSNWQALNTSTDPSNNQFGQTYISSWPTDPRGGSYQYIYTVNSSQKKFVVDATLERSETADSTINCSDPNQASFWKSGIVDCAGVNHYRRSGQ